MLFLIEKKRVQINIRNKTKKRENEEWALLWCSSNISVSAALTVNTCCGQTSQRPSQLCLFLPSNSLFFSLTGFLCDLLWTCIEHLKNLFAIRSAYRASKRVCFCKSVSVCSHMTHLVHVIQCPWQFGLEGH